METIAEQQVQTYEGKKTFDVLASVNRLRYDLAQRGYILPETLDQVCDEEFSYLAEGAGEASRSTFALKRQGEQLVYFDRGQWRPYMGMLMTGREVARREAVSDPRKHFLAERSETDLYMGLQMQNLRPGQVLSWYADYPYEIEAHYGAEFLNSEGFISARKMGFLYRAFCQVGGSVLLESQTVDNSNEEAFAAAMSPEMQMVGMDAMLGAYDQVLARKHGRQFYAGRLGGRYGENAWESVISQRDLMDYFLARLEAIARSSAEGSQLEEMVKRHIYGTWAAFKNRLDGRAVAYESRSLYGVQVAMPMSVEHEVQRAFAQFAMEGRPLIGCGGSIEILMGEENILSADSADVFSAIFGSGKNDNGKCEFMSKSCPECGEKNVWTKVTSTHISGSCGCKVKK